VVVVRGGSGLPYHVVPVRTMSHPGSPSPASLAPFPFLSLNFMPEMAYRPAIPKLALTTTLLVTVTVTDEDVVRTRPLGTGSLTVYVPGRRFLKLYIPLSSVVALATTFPSSSRLTSPPGMPGSSASCSPLPLMS